MKRKFLILGFFFCMAFFLTGCAEQQQLHQKLIVQGVGIDKVEENYKVIIQALDFQNPMNEDEPNTKIIETEGKTVMEALDNISKQVSLQPVYSQNLMLILGKNAVKSGVNEFIDFFIRHCETRPKVKICVSNTVSEILKIKPNEKSLKSKNIHDLVPQSLNSDILHFVSNLKNTKTDPCAAWLEMEEKNGSKEVHLKGACIFNEDKLVDFLEGEEAFGFMLLKGVSRFDSCIISAESCGEVTCIAENVVPKIHVDFQENTPIFHIDLDINASTYSLDKNFYTHSFEEISSAIEERLSEKINNICSKLLEKTLKLNADVFDFSKTLRNSYPEYFKKIENRWKQIFPYLKFEINQNVKLKVTGKEPV